MKDELEIDEAPENWLNFCFIWTLLLYKKKITRIISLWIVMMKWTLRSFVVWVITSLVLLILRSITLAMVLEFRQRVMNVDVWVIVRLFTVVLFILLKQLSKILRFFIFLLLRHHHQMSCFRNPQSWFDYPFSFYLFSFWLLCHLLCQRQQFKLEGFIYLRVIDWRYR